MAGTLGEESNKIHQDSDVDNSMVALHHTLGRSATQAAAGNHNHDTSYSEITHSHEDLAGSDHLHALGMLSDVVLNAPGTDQFLGYGPDGNWTNESIPTEAHSQIAATPPVPRGLGDLWVDTSADLLSWDDAWITLTLLNGWVIYNAGYTCKYRKVAGGLVVVKGLVTNPSAISVGSIICNLPVGYRVDQKHHLASRSNSGYAALGLEATGNLVLDTALTANTWFSIVCTFYADA